MAEHRRAVADGADEPRGHGGELKPGQLSVWSSVGSAVLVQPAGVARHGEQAEAIPGARDDQDQPGGVAVE